MVLTHRGRDKIPTYSNVISWKKIYEYRLLFPNGEIYNIAALAQTIVNMGDTVLHALELYLSCSNPSIYVVYLVSKHIQIDDKKNSTLSYFLQAVLHSICANEQLHTWFKGDLHPWLFSSCIHYATAHMKMSYSQLNEWAKQGTEFIIVNFMCESIYFRYSMKHDYKIWFMT